MAGPPGRDAGGIRGLVGLLTEHGGAIEADLQQFYGVTLSDLTVGRLTWRRLGVLVRQLPTESRVLAIMSRGTSAEWPVSDHLLALILDALHGANWQRGGGKSARPRPVRRPGTDTRSTYGRADRSPRETATYLAKFAPPPKGGPDGC